MAKLSKQQATLFIIILTVAAIAAVKTCSFAPKPIDSVAARSKGNPEAKVRITEFIDFQCPACGHGSKILKDYISKYPQDMLVQLKYFPLTRPHRHAMQSALYSECAGRQGKFWEFHEVLIEQQAQWSELLSADAVFRDIAKKAGINEKQLDACLIATETTQTINNDRALGESLGVQSTPSYFINDKMVVGSKSLLDELNKFFPPLEQPKPAQPEQTPKA